MSVQRCDGCRFWKRKASFGASTLGECRRRAPVIAFDGTLAPPTKFPAMLGHDPGCGEFELRNESEVGDDSATRNR